MRVLCVECKNPYAHDLLAGLAKTEHKVTHGGSHDLHNDARDLGSLEGCENINLFDSVALYRRDTLRQKYRPYFELLDVRCMDFFAPIERDFYILTDRSNYDSVSFRQRKLYFRDLIRFWLGYLKKENIEAVYCPYAPHVGWELVLMQTARYLNIPFVYFSHTAINNRSLLRASYQNIDSVPDDYLKDMTPDEIRAQIDPEFLKDFYEDSVVTAAIKAENDEFQKQKINTDEKLVSQLKDTKSPSPLIGQVRSLLGHFYNNSLRRFRPRFYLPMAMDDHSTIGHWNAALKHHARTAAALKSCYEQKAKPINLEHPYVYFPMHLQPEMTTQPEAGIFEDHHLVLEQILQALPAGWKIYVKENPRQYDVTINAVSAINFRDKADLLDLLDSSPNVHLVPQSIPTPDLIDNAQVVVTQTGTVGWECLTRGKAVVTFGRPWYSGCRACFKVNHADDLGEAFVAAPAMTRQQIETHMLRFLHYYQDKFFIGSLSDPTNVAYNTRPYEALVKGHLQAMTDYFSSLR